MGPNPIRLVSLLKGKIWTQRQTCTEGRLCDDTRGEIHANMKAEVRVRHQQAKKCQRLPANHEKLGKRLGTEST